MTDQPKPQPEYHEDTDPAKARVFADGEEIHLRLDQPIHWPIVCCDCGLTHIVRIARNREGFTLRFYRAAAATEVQRAENKRVIADQMWRDAIKADEESHGI